MSLVTRTQYTTEVIPYQLNFRAVCVDSAGAVVRTVSSATAAATSGITAGTPVVASTSVTVPVSGGTAGTTYNLRCTATFSDGTIRTYEWLVSVTAPVV